MLWPLNTVTQIVVSTPHHEIIFLLLHTCNFATVMNHNVKIWYVCYLICDPQSRTIACDSPKILAYLVFGLTTKEFGGMGSITWSEPEI